MDEYKRINLLIGAQAALASGQEEGMPGIVSDSAYRFGWFSAGVWRLAALHGASESFADVTLDNGTANALLRFDSTKKLAPGLLRDDGTTCYHPTQFYQWTSERTQSAQYVKTDTTTITGAVSTEKSLITGLAYAAGGYDWAGITIPAGRVNVIALLSSLKLKGQVSSSGSTLITWRIRVNGSIVATQNTTRNWGSTNWRIEGDATTRSTGSSGTRRWDMGLYADADNANAATSYYDLSFLSTLNLVAASTIDVTVEFSDASTSVSCTQQRTSGTRDASPRLTPPALPRGRRPVPSPSAPAHRLSRLQASQNHRTEGGVKRYFAIMPDPNLTMSGISIAGFFAVYKSIKFLKKETKTETLESDEYRAKTRAIADDAAKDKASKADLEAVKVRVRSLEGKKGEDLTETKAFRREVIQ